LIVQSITETEMALQLKVDQSTTGRDIKVPSGYIDYLLNYYDSNSKRYHSLSSIKYNNGHKWDELSINGPKGGTKANESEKGKASKVAPRIK
jgi:hypothetical protein